MLTVTLPHHSYQIIVEKGSLQTLGKWASSLWTPRKIAIITDETVDQLYGKQVLNQLQEHGFETIKVAIPPGEASKSLTNVDNLYKILANEQFTRSDGILALGGGVIGDLAGFVAATYMRGIPYLQVPTTLLAQVDSSIGGKTGVNTNQAKNLVGAFWQPDGVLIDPHTLKTLDSRRTREGIAEIIKTAAIADYGLWENLEQMTHETDLLNQVEAVITACLEVKRKVVEKDELDHGIRLILNFGHTIGHGIEQTAGYGVISHGEAISLGMVQISRVAEKKQLMPSGITTTLKAMLQKFNLPVEPKKWDQETLYNAIIHDKKARGKQIKLVLLEAIGIAKITTVTIEEMKDYLERVN